MTALELAEWEAYAILEPMGEWKRDFDLGYGLSVITNLFIGAYGKQGAQLTKPEDFIIQWGKPTGGQEEKQSVESMKHVLLALAKTQNEKEKKKRTPLKK